MKLNKDLLDLLSLLFIAIAAGSSLTSYYLSRSRKARMEVESFDRDLAAILESLRCNEQVKRTLFYHLEIARTFSGDPFFPRVKVFLHPPEGGKILVWSGDSEIIEANYERWSSEVRDEILAIARQEEAIEDWRNSRFVEQSEDWVDPGCRFNARSEYLRCAVNPCGPCFGCSHRDK